MSIMIGQHEFEGPLKSISDSPTCAGLYAILEVDNMGYYLVDICEANNLANLIRQSFQNIEKRFIVTLECRSRAKRKLILDEIVKEFEYDDDELFQNGSRRTETNSGVAVAI